MTANSWSGFSICRSFDQKLFSSGREYYFGGVLSKVERSQAGVIEAIITYSNLSEVEGRFYSRQAKEFVERTEQIKQRNQAILGKPVPSASHEAGGRDTTRSARLLLRHLRQGQPQHHLPQPAAA